MAFSNTTPQPTQAAADPRSLDILFLQDATGSQGQYISSARSAIQDICEKISLSTSLSRGSIRFGLIAFRDHPPQDTSYVTKNFGFTADVPTMTRNLAYLTASGGGDGPEAQTAALAEALNVDWAEDAVKIVVLITDAPPHGLGEDGDGFTESPDQNDPLEIARQMAERGITIYVIACEPTLSQYKHAVDFYRAICQICRGRMIPLLNASKLGDYIVGSAVETIETEKLIEEFQSVILEDVYGQGKPIDLVMKDVQAQLSKRNVHVQTLNIEDVYEPSVHADYNTDVWATEPTVPSARDKVIPVPGSRLKSGYFCAGSRDWDTPYRTPALSVFERFFPPQASSDAESMPMTAQAVDRAQTERIVIQSLMRGSKVGPGNVFTPIGEYASKPSASYTTDLGSDLAVEEEVYAEEEALVELCEEDYISEEICSLTEAPREVEVCVAEESYISEGEEVTEPGAYEAQHAEMVDVAPEEYTEEVSSHAEEEGISSDSETYETGNIVEVSKYIPEEVVREVSNLTDDADEEAFVSEGTMPEFDNLDEPAERLDLVAEGIVSGGGRPRESGEIFVCEETISEW